MTDAIAETNKLLGSWEKICPICQKHFFPRSEHAYVHNHVKFCSYSCYLKRGTLKNRKKRPYCKPVDQFDLSGKYIKSYPSGADAARAVGVSGDDIRRCCRGQRKQAGGFIWKHKPNSNAKEELPHD